MLQYPVLRIPDFTQPMILHTDASDVGLGATLSQKGEEGNMHLVACRSRKLSPAEKNYPVHEKEMLALVDTLEEWRHYLLVSEVQVFTDNSALNYLQKNPRPSPRQVRWLERLQWYQLKVAHIPGRQNVAADALSRYPLENLSTEAKLGVEDRQLIYVVGARSSIRGKVFPLHSLSISLEDPCVPP